MNRGIKKTFNKKEVARVPVAVTMVVATTAVTTTVTATIAAATTATGTTAAATKVTATTAVGTTVAAQQGQAQQRQPQRQWLQWRQQQPGLWQSGSDNPSLASQLWQPDSCKSGFGNLALGSGNLACAIWIWQSGYFNPSCNSALAKWLWKLSSSNSALSAQV